MRPPAAWLLTAALLAGCVSPSRTDDDYERKAGNTAKSAASSVATALVGAQLGADHKAFGNYLSVLIGAAEKDTSSVQGTFDSVQPPSAKADQLRNTVDAMLSDALNGLAALRIAVRRGEVSSLPEVAQPLSHTLTQLRALADTYS